MNTSNPKNAGAKRKKELLNPEGYRIYFFEREYDILNRAFKGESYRAIGEIYGISRQRVEQLIIRETKRLIKVTNLQCQNSKPV